MRYEIFVIALILLNVATVSAQLSCQDNEIFLLSSPENAHGANCTVGSLYNQSGVIKGWTSPSSTSRVCDGSNLVIRLSPGSNNSHAEFPSSNPSYENVCYGNMRCGTDPLFGPCFYKLSSATNAHIGSCSSSYPITVYCRDNLGSGSPITTGGCPSPQASINLPLNKTSCDAYGSSTNVKFNQTQLQDDTCYNYQWDFGDGTQATTWETTHTYSSHGQKLVILTVSSKDGGKVSQDTREILVVAGNPGDKFVCAKIRSPQQSNNFKTGEFALYSGNQSYALQVNPGGQLKCLAGECPSKLKNPDGTDSSTNIGAGGWGVANDENTKWGELSFIWEFGDGNVFKGDSYTGSSIDKAYASPGTYLTKLTVFLKNNPSLNNGTDNVTVQINLGPGCYNQRTLFIDTSGNQYATNAENAPGSGISTFAQCFGLDGDVNTESDNCCAGTQGWTCQKSGPNINHCVKDASTLNFCSSIDNCGNYTTQADCNADLCGIVSSGGVTGDCRIIGTGSVHCFWNLNRCSENASSQDACRGRGETFDPGADCIKNFTMTSCSANQFILSWVTSMFGVTPAQKALLGCTDGQKAYSCGRVAKLAFFTLRNTVGVIMLLIAFYLIINRKKISKKLQKR